MRDMIIRQRPKKKIHRLTEQEKNEIADSEITISQFALKYDVSHSTIVKAKAKNRINSKRKRNANKPSIQYKNRTKQKSQIHN